MTHQNHQTNGASLEDCHTNFFALTDLCGIKWRKLVLGETPFSPEPLDDPVLSSFSRCLAGDILCVWRRVAVIPPPPDQGGGGGGLFDISLGGGGHTSHTGTVTHPPLALTAAKELWIFWYGEEPDLTELVAPELISSGDGDNGCWESGLSYECRSLLFKALHNLIERCLLSRDFVRLGKWFVQPHTYTEKPPGISNTHLSFSFAFFVHGESTVCASVDVRQHPPVRCLSKQYLQQIQTDQGGPRPVILAPFGMAGTLTGQTARTMDPSTQRLLDDWKQFYPIGSHDQGFQDNSLPPAVEVTVGGVKMRYPSCYVLVTDMDKNSPAGVVPDIKCPMSNLPQSTVLTTPPASPPDSPNSLQHNLVPPHITPLGPPSMVLSPTPATALPERVWQDCIMNPEFTKNQESLNSSTNPSEHSVASVENDQNSENASFQSTCINSCTSGLLDWEFTDPLCKVTCSCSKSRKYIGRSSHGKTSKGGDKNGVTSRCRVPFHRRSPLPRDTAWLSHPFDQPARLVGSTTPNNPPSYPRSQGGLNDNLSLPVPSVGSPASANPSPLPNPNSQQPASVPPCDSTMPTLSPHPPTSLPPPTQPVTPSEHHDKNTPAATPTDGNGPKSVSSLGNTGFSPYPVPPSMEGKPPECGGTTTPSLPHTGSLKRPILSSREYESALHEEEQTLELLYDYSTMDAWLNHPVKRFKPNENKEVRKLGRGQDLYSSHVHSRPLSRSSDPVPIMSMSIKQEIKQEPGEDGKDGKCLTGNLFTNEGLQVVGYKDLEQIFDNSDDTSGDETLQVHTPPGSNNPGIMEDYKRMSSGHNMGILRPEELSKMFPTPPSLEHNPISSPCGGGFSDGTTGEGMDGPMMTRFKQEIYPNMGSPQEEIIDDWSYVFKLPTLCKYVGSSKYAPLTNLPSQTLPPVTLPPHYIYKPKMSWQQHANTNNNNPNTDRNGPPVNQMGHQMIPPGPASSSRPNSVSSIAMGLSHRAGLSPISPASHFPPSPMHSNLNMHMNPFRTGGPGSVRTPCPPPPPYEMHSPATSTASSYLNKNMHSVEAATPCIFRSTEANSLVVNLLLGDTVLNIFRDHNFDSCTLCVCNAGPKVVGNIRGADAGIYLAPPTGAGSVSMMGGNSSLPPVSPMQSGPVGGGPPPPYGMIASPATPHHTSAAAVNGYVDDDPIRCNCGFSAVVNRRLAHRSGLFFEDEMEITGLADDPSENKKISLLNYLSEGVKTEPGVDRVAVDNIPQNVMELLREQCIIVQSPSRSLHRAARRYRQNPNNVSVTLNALEFMDGNDVTSLALEQCRQAALENSSSMCKMEDIRNSKYGNSVNTSVHKWPFIRAAGPQCNQDIVRVMKSLQPLLQDAIQKKCTTRLWDAPYTVSGPLTWRQFHRLAGRGTDDLCEPQPIPSLVVGHEKDWLSLSPYALQYWDKLLLEPYSYTRDIAYIVVAPDNEAVVNKTRTFFKELSTTYEICRLGRHTPISKMLRDGILRISSTPKNLLANESIDDWFALLGVGRMVDMLKLYVKVCKQHLTPLLNDKTLLDSDSYYSGRDRCMPSPMPPPHTPDPNQPDKAPSTPKPDQESDTIRDAFGSSLNSELNHDEDEQLPPSIVIYLVEPFTMGSDSPDLERLSCLALLRCFCSILSSIPDSVRNNVTVQIISQESIMELGRCRDAIRYSDHMRALALSVFSQCRRHLIHTSNIKSLTGFGTAAQAELYLKAKDEKNKAPYKLYTPPYILAPHKEKIESAESFGQVNSEECSVMYLSYCLSEDQSWLLAVATDDRGELLESITINIDIPNRKRRKKASARRTGLQKLMDFILGVMSQSVQPWRLVIGRIGRIGHGELKGWSFLLSRKNLMKASKHLKEICSQCALMYPAVVPSILSACLVSLEPDSALRLMPDQFTPDERFSQASVNSNLSTPQDVTCTHILVFPTSATTQSSQTAFQEQHLNGDPDLGDEELFSALNDDMPDGIDGMNDFNDIFNTWPDAGAGGMQSPTGSPKREESRPESPSMGGESNQQSPFPCNNTNRGGNSASDVTEEVGTLLQQPLALGYLVSTAPTGRMPHWFWASCPHLENVCPAFLKNALHLHSPAIQQNSDDLLQQQSAVTVHPLDSQYTTDVLRYVLEGYNALSWLAMDTNTNDRLSCLPVHVQVLMQLYHMTASLV